MPLLNSVRIVGPTLALRGLGVTLILLIGLRFLVLKVLLVSNESDASGDTKGTGEDDREGVGECGGVYCWLP